MSRKRLQQLLHSRQHNQTFLVVYFDLLDDAQLGNIIQMRTQIANGLNGATAMRNPDRKRRIDTAHLRIALPTPFDRTERTHQHAIHVEEQPAYFQLHALLHAHAAPPARSAKVRAASNILRTDSGEQDSQ